MATKLKVNIYTWKFKLLLFAIIIFSAFQITVSLTLIKDIAYYLGADTYNVNYNMGRSKCIEIAELAYKDMYESPVQADLQKLDEYLGKGFRYFIFEGERVAYQSDRNNYITSRSNFFQKYSDIYNAYGGTYYEKHYETVAIPTEKYLADLNTWKTNVKSNGRNCLLLGILWTAVFLTGIVFIGKTAGQKEKCGQVYFRLYDKIYSDILLIIYTVLSVGAIYSFAELGKDWINDKNAISTEPLYILILGVSVFISSITYLTVQNLSKRIKTKSLINHTLLFHAGRKTHKFMDAFKRVIIQPVKAFSNKSIKRKLIIYALCSDFLLCVTGLFIIGLFNNWILSFLWFALVVSALLFACIIIILKEFQGVEEIKKGTFNIRQGNLTYKIPACKSNDINEIAQNINNISDGFEQAVKTATTSEKMKTELITNVSHDLKTPLTSIISYIELLSEDEMLSEQAKDYVFVIKQKSQRLKAIIADLFDLSKSISGNLDINIEKLDFKKLIEQTLADMDDIIISSKKVLRVELPDNEVYINADGKRLYRVFQNIIDNALKYSLDNTRIYLTLYERDGRSVMELSNISAYEMTFNEKEIIERFVRGDKSRSTDGNGLGLSIAESFTTLCGGNMKIKIDGDVFKVIIEFKTVS